MPQLRCATPLPADWIYTDEEWAESAGHDPLRGVDRNVWTTLRRQWFWADLQRGQYDLLLAERRGPLDTEWPVRWDVNGYHWLWCALLYSVIEGFWDQKIEIRGPWREDIEAAKARLRRLRNAVFHAADVLDDRLYVVKLDADLAPRIRRMHLGFGRLFDERLALDVPFLTQGPPEEN